MYLPSMIRTCMSTANSVDLTDVVETERLSHLLKWIHREEGSVYRRRFVREHPNEAAIAYYLFVLNIAYRLPQEILQVSLQPPLAGFDLSLT